ncbi:MAG: nucleotidyltransferase family protein, partial [Chloroflexi bacterium]|nr:nucleotidyltransferase family protein [Chloroflexota bacterium]
EGVGPLLYWHFKNENWPPGIPKGVAAALMGQYYSTLGQNTMLFRELDRILAAFAEANIPVILLKGAALAQTIYPDPALRPMGDLDLLVEKDDLERAVASAQNLGYWEDIVELRPGLSWEMGLGHHIHLQNEQHANLELHWRLIGGADDWRSPPAEWVWAQAEQSDPKKPYQVLNTHAHILYISAHQALQHGLANARLIWFYDVYVLLKAENTIDWGALITFSQETDWGASLSAVLSGVAKCFDYPVPEFVLQHLAETASRDATLVRQRAESGVTRTESVWQVVSALKGSSKLKLVWAYLFPSPARMRYRYRPKPAWLWALYYPYRWGDIFCDIIGTGLTQLRSNLPWRTRRSQRNSKNRAKLSVLGVLCGKN